MESDLLRPIIHPTIDDSSLLEDHHFDGKTSGERPDDEHDPNNRWSGRKA